MTLILALDGIAAPAADILLALPGATFKQHSQASAEEKKQDLAIAEVVLIRSATKADREFFKQAPKLKLIVRAGIGLDNVDVAAATERGVMVMNTPSGNMVTTAEHAVSLLTSLARSIPQATASMKAGKWEKGKFLGRELRGKTLGVIGLGNIGKIVARLANGLGMKVVAFDPFVSEQQARAMDVTKLELNEVFRQADAVTVHVPLTEQTKYLINETSFQMMKKGVLVVNCARGGIVNEQALLQALNNGTVAGAALDVFEQEPTAPGHPLVSHAHVICTPHLGAATEEAQLAVSLEAAEQIRDFLSRGEIRNAVNHPPISESRFRTLSPYVTLAESMGNFLGQWTYGQPLSGLTIRHEGLDQEQDGAVLSLAVLKGLLEPALGEKVNFVNAKQLARAREIQLMESSGEPSGSFARSLQATLQTQGGEQVSLTGTLFGNSEPRFVEFCGFRIDGTPGGWMLVTLNRDVPNMVGQIGSVLGKSKINIASMHLGRHPRDGRACAMTNVDSEIPDAVVEEIRVIHGVELARKFYIGKKR